MATPVTTAAGFPQPPQAAFNTPSTPGGQLPGTNPLNARPHPGQYGPVLPYVDSSNFFSLPQAAGSGANQTLLSTLTQLNNRGYQNVAESQALSPVVEQMRRARQSMAVSGASRGLQNSGIMNAGRQGVEQQYQQGVLGANAAGQAAENARQQQLLRSLLASAASERQAVGAQSKVGLQEADVNLGGDQMASQSIADVAKGEVTLAALLAGGAYGAAAGAGGAAAGSGAAAASGAMTGLQTVNSLYGGGGGAPNYNFQEQAPRSGQNSSYGSNMGSTGFGSGPANDPFGLRSPYSSGLGGARINEGNRYLGGYN